MSKVDKIALDFAAGHPDDCSCVLMRWWQVLWYCVVAALCLAGLAYRWDVVLCIVNFVLAFWYFSIILFRVCIVSVSALGHGLVRVTSSQLRELVDDELPVYTILVPLYREANVADRIIRNLRQLDYPPSKLDVKLLLEEDDPATLAAVRSLDLPATYELVIIPDSQPRTKPKACDYGLRRAKGQFCVVLDAEDRPDPDQLMKAVAAFRRLPDRVACLQARLNYYNPRQNLLTRWFTVEYTTTFDLYYPGLQCANIPMPLGGTSNHFRMHVLKELGGWDPFNVTEDCDLGVRLYRMGYQTRMLDSTTWEEANSRLGNWMRQRSRWIKGFFQTHLTHTRNPLRTLRELGPWGYFGFLLSVGGSSFMMVLNLFYWVVSGTYLLMVAQAVSKGYAVWEILKGPRELLAGSYAWPMIYYGPKEDAVWSTLSIVFFVIACALLLANFLLIFIHCLACMRRRFYDLLPFALLMPIYWVLISIGAWKGMLQLLARPFHWEKTIHGLDTSPGRHDSSGLRPTWTGPIRTVAVGRKTS